jgi:hypothetical protein
MNSRPSHCNQFRPGRRQRRLERGDTVAPERIVLRHRQHGQRYATAGAADRQVRVIVTVGLLQQRAAEVGLELAVLLDDGDLAAGDGVAALGGVLQPTAEAGTARPKTNTAANAHRSSIDFLPSRYLAPIW